MSNIQILKAETSTSLSATQPPIPFQIGTKKDAINKIYYSAEGRYLNYLLKEHATRLKKECKDSGGTPSEEEILHFQDKCEIKSNSDNASLVCPPSKVVVECKNSKGLMNESGRKFVKPTIFDGALEKERDFYSGAASK
jgi:hypothetical protein